MSQTGGQVQARRPRRAQERLADHFSSDVRHHGQARLHASRKESRLGRPPCSLSWQPLRLWVPANHGCSASRKDRTVSCRPWPPRLGCWRVGICRALEPARLSASLLEFPLANRRRADVLALGRTGRSGRRRDQECSVADFRADRKWASYREFADRLYFAVPSEFPAISSSRKNVASLVADGFGAAVLTPRRPPPAPRRGPAPCSDAALRAGRGRPAAPPSRPGGGMARQRRVTGTSIAGRR